MKISYTRINIAINQSSRLRLFTFNGMNKNKGLVRKNMRSILGGFTSTPNLALLLSFSVIFLNNI